MNKLLTVVGILFISSNLSASMQSTPNIRPFDCSKLTERYIWNEVVVGKFNEVRIDSRGEEHLHQGIDYALVKNTPIIATGGGKVIYAEWEYGYGNTIIIDHGDGYTTLYAHMQRFNVLQGNIIKRKQVIGFVGATGIADGNHIHYELRRDGIPIFPGMFIKIN